MRFERILLLAITLFTAACSDTSGPPRPGRLQPVSGDVAGAVVGAAHPVSVRLTDTKGKPLANHPVQWTVTDGGGAVSAAMSRTDATGVARTEWTLGTVPGRNLLAARVEGLTGPIFTAMTMAGEPTGMVVQGRTPEASSVGMLVAPAPAVFVHDRYGNPVPGVLVRFAITAGEGTLEEAERRTNAQGIAAMDGWTLGAAPGPNALSASVEGIPPVEFMVEARPFNLWIEGVHLNQGSQTAFGWIGAVSGRPGLLRVVVRANGMNTFAPVVRVRLLQGDRLLREVRIEAPSTGVPTAPSLAELRESWNLTLVADEVVPGLAVEAVVDPDAVIPDTDRTDNRFPREPGATVLHASAVPPLRILFVPIHATKQGRTGAITNENLGAFLEATRQWIPSSTILTAIHAPFTTAQDLTTAAGWSGLLSELQAVRTAEGAVDEYYHGIIPHATNLTNAGIAYRPSESSSPFRSGLTHDLLPSATATVAHEIGHNLGRMHTPCGNPANADPNYPHPNAQLGSPGYDILTGKLVSTQGAWDFMSYCWPRWTSDYSFEGMLKWRRNDVLAVWELARPDVGLSRERDGLLLWGQIGSRGATLQPAFTLSARPVLPLAGGPNELRGVAADGTIVFRLSFEGVATADGADPDERHFAFFLPLSRSEIGRIERIELITPRGAAVQRATPAAGVLEKSAASVLRLDGGRGGAMRVQWDASRYPMLILREPGTGQVRAIVRGGEAAVSMGAMEPLEAILSDGVRSEVARVRE